MSKFGLSDDVYRRMLGDFEKFNKKLHLDEPESKVELSPELRGQTKAQPDELKRGETSRAELIVAETRTAELSAVAEPKKPVSSHTLVNIDTLFNFLNKKGTNEIKYKLDKVLAILNPGLNLTGPTGTVAEPKPANAELKPASATAPSSKKVE
jgi:hypothetical protein